MFNPMYKKWSSMGLKNTQKMPKTKNIVKKMYCINFVMSLTLLSTQTMLFVNFQSSFVLFVKFQYGVLYM